MAVGGIDISIFIYDICLVYERGDNEADEFVKLEFIYI